MKMTTTKTKKKENLKMTKNRLFIPAFAALGLSLLAACDGSGLQGRFRNEQEDSTYRSALADYRAGRLDAAAAGFEKAIRKNPANASARFQYACLMQDMKKDWLEAFCAYREFLAQRPDSDKARIARDRMAVCERELAAELAAKHRLAGNEAFTKEISALRQDLKAAEARAVASEKAFEEEHARYQALEDEHGRLLAAVKGTGAEESATPAHVELKDLLEEDAEDDSPRQSTFADAKALKDEEGDETAESGPSILPEQTAYDRERRDAAKAEADRASAARAKKNADAAARRPKTYVVQEGDTLYKIALRFYGRVAAWRRIRDANKAIISNDGRVKAGQEISLP